jgi:hypothetical protein
MACVGCGTCDGNPPPDPDTPAAAEPDQVTSLIDDIEDIVKWENGGHATDWSCYSFAHAKLVTVWREAENHLSRIQTSRMQSFLLGWMKSEE